MGLAIRLYVPSPTRLKFIRQNDDLVNNSGFMVADFFVILSFVEFALIL